MGIEELRKNSVSPSPGILVFNQIDVDGSGTIETRELQRLLKSLPEIKSLPFEDMMKRLDTNQDGVISLEEWLQNVEELPELHTAVVASLDPETGKVRNYRSLEEQLAKLMGEIVKLERRCWDGEDVAEKLEEKRTAAKKLQDKSVKPSPGILVFDQIDIDNSGSIERKELGRLLKALPEKKPGPGVEPLSFEDMLTKLDTDGNGVIDIEEWLHNLQKLPGLHMAIMSALDPDTGKVRNYRSLEDQMAKLMGDLVELERKCWAGEDVVEKLTEKRSSVKRFQENGVKPSPGVLVFNQVVDRSNSIDRKELGRLLKALPKKKPAPGVKFVPFDELVAKLDTDGDGVVDLDEWLHNLEKLPGLRMAIQAGMDPETGKIRNYRSLEDQLAKLKAEVVDLERKCWAGEDVLDKLTEKRASVKKLVDKGVKPSPGVLTFNQIDIDGSGSIDRKELGRLLKALPDTTPPPGLEHLPTEEMLTRLDANGDGIIDLDEWLHNLEKLPQLYVTLIGAMDPDTGKVRNYRSLEEQLAKLMGEVSTLETKAAAGEDVAEKLGEKQGAVKKLQGKGVKPSPGVLVFDQIDVDGSVTVDRKELGGF